MATTSTEERKINIILDGKQVNASLREMEGAAAVMNNQLKKMAADDPGRKALLQEFKQMKDRIGDAKQELYGMEKASQSVAASGGLMKQAFASALGFLTAGGIAGIAEKVLGYFTDSQEAFRESAAANAQLEASLASTGKAAGITKKEIEDIANIRMGKTLFDDDATKGAASLLLTFTDVKKGVFEEALPAIQDLAQKMAGDGPADLKGSTIQVGKALNDPIKGITALSRVGVSFSESQKAMIKSLVETGDKAGAQKIILAELNKEFGGSAEAARKAGGGWATLKMQLGEISENVGGFIQGGLNKLSDFLGIILDKSAPVVAIFEALWGELQSVYREISGVIQGLGIFNSESSMAETVVKALSFAFTVLLTPIKITVGIVKALVENFVSLYNSSEAVRGTLGGLGQVAVQVFTNLKNAALNILGGVGDILVGIFDLDPERIKSGFKKATSGVADAAFGLGKGAADAYNQGYEANKNNKIVLPKGGTKEAADPAETAAAVKAAEEKADAISKAQLKKLKEHQDKVKKAQEEFGKAEAQAELELAKLKVEVMNEGIDKVLAKLKLQHDQELKEMTKQRAAVMANIAATAAEKAAAVAVINENEKLTNEQFEAATKAAKEAQHKTDLEAWYTQLDQEEEYQLEVKKNQLFNTFDAEFQMEQARLQLHRDTAAQKLADLEISGQGETLAAIKLKNDILKTDKEIADGKVANAKKTAEIKKTIEQASFQAANAFFDLGIQLLGQDEAARKKNATAIKAFSTAKILTNLYTEISGYMESPASVATGGILGGVLSALAVVRAGMAIDTVTAQKFAVGGHTSTIGTFAGGGHVGSARLGLIGEAGAEWVGPNWMLSSPKYASTFAWLEAERRGSNVRAFADGGATASMPGGATTAQPPLPDILVNEIRLMRQDFAKVEMWANTLKVDYHAGNAEIAMQVRKQIQQGGSW